MDPPEILAVASDMRLVPRSRSLCRRAIEGGASAKTLRRGCPDVPAGRRGSRRCVSCSRPQVSSPYDDGDEIRVRNCPFHPLAAMHMALVCGMNHELVAGAAEALGLDLPLRLDPRPGECCVVVST